MPLHDYRCPEHGLFESFEAACKTEGCQNPVTQVFLKPVGTVSARTRGIDRELRLTAESFGMTDLRSAREGENQMGYMPKVVPYREPEPVSQMPENIQWGSWGKHTADTVMAGKEKLDVGLAPVSPLRSFVNLKKMTQITHVAPAIKKTAQGLIE